MAKRKKNRWPAVLLFLMVIAVTAFILVRFVFVVRSVQIAGEADMSSEEIIRHGNIGFGESIFRVDAKEIERSINSTGDIAFAGMTVDYPDTLVLQVEQRTPAAMILHAGKMLVLDKNACAMESLAAAPDTDLVFVSDFNVSGFRIGDPVYADDQQIADYCAVMQAISDHGASGYVSEVQMGNSNELHIITRRGIDVKLGSRSNMMDKIAYMKSAVADLENRGEYGGTLDVSSGTKADYLPS